MNVSHFLSLLLYRTKANLKAEVTRYYLHYLWWVIEPLLTLCTFYIVFGLLLKSNIDNFAAFLMIGISMWRWLNQTVLNASTSITQGCGLILQVKINKVFFPLEILLRDLFKQLVVMFVLFLFLVISGVDITLTWIAFPLLFLVQTVLIVAMSFWVSSIIPFVPDLKIVVSTLLTMMFYGSGIFYNIENVLSPELSKYVYLNPMAGLIKNYRDVLLYNQWPEWWYITKVFIFSFVFLIGGFFQLKWLNNHYPRLCQ